MVKQMPNRICCGTQWSMRQSKDYCSSLVIVFSSATRYTGKSLTVESPVCSAVHCCTGLSSPIIPIIVVFQLLWSAAGVKLWRRHQALLKRQWSISNKNLQSTPPLSSTSTSGRTFGHQTVNAGTGYQAGGGGGAVLRQPSLSQSHFRGGVPEWAAQAPTATGTRWQFVGACMLPGLDYVAVKVICICRTAAWACGFCCMDS